MLRRWPSILRGHYRIDLHLRDGAAFLSKVEGIASFNVNEQISFDGVVDLDFTVKIVRG
jgi:hypothetical protein